MPLQQVNNFNVNSQLNLTKKNSNNANPTANPTAHKQNTFSHGHQGSQHSQVEQLVPKTNSRNGPRGESLNENGGPGGSQFHGDTGHDYNIQMQQEQMQAQNGEYARRQIAGMTATGN